MNLANLTNRVIKGERSVVVKLPDGSTETKYTSISYSGRDLFGEDKEAFNKAVKELISKDVSGSKPYIRMGSESQYVETIDGDSYIIDYVEYGETRSWYIVQKFKK